MGNLFDTHTERAALRCALVEPELFRNHLDPGDFFDEQNRAVWQAARDTIAAGRPVNFGTLSDAMEAAGHPNGFILLSEIEDEGYDSPAYFDAYAETLRKWAKKRDMLALYAQAQRTPAGDEPPDVDRELDALIEQLERLKAKYATKAETAVTPTTWADMSEAIGPVCWDWPGYLPSAFLTELVADSGTGKSIVALRICQTYLTGAPWPDGTPYMGASGKVLWCEAEAAQALNLERATAWGLPCANILSPLQNPLDDVNLFDDGHRGAIGAIANRDDVRLIVVDSLSGACGGKEKAEEMMPIVKWLAELARNTNKPVLLLHHLRKKGVFDGGDGVAKDRVRGSTVIIQPARVVWALDVPNLNEADHVRFSVIKNNLGRSPDALGLRIGDDGVKFDAAPTAPKSETQLDKAADLLRALLDSGPLPSAKVEAESKGAGISWDTMTRAQKKLGIVARRDGKLKVWTWALPAREQEQDAS